MTDCSSLGFKFPACRKRRVEAEFSGGDITSNGGVLLLRQADRLSGLTANTALRLARYFGTTPQVWLNLQKTYELRRAEIEAGRQIAERVKPRQAVA